MICVLPGMQPLFVLEALAGRGERVIVTEPCRREERLEAVEVGLADRVELVVMAPRTADRQAQEDQPGRLGDVVERILAAQALVIEVDHVGIAAIEPRGDECRRITGPELVARKLQADERVIRQVAIEGLDDPVAIAPGVGPGLVEFEAVGLGEPRQVEPVLPPALAVMRARQQTIDEPLIGERRPSRPEMRRAPRAWAAARSGRSSTGAAGSPGRLRGACGSRRCFEPVRG